jgi:SAM-dependent methyltransferase
MTHNNPIDSLKCKICDRDAVLIGAKSGKLEPRVFHFYRCTGCGFVFVGDPWTDYAAIYSEDYYRGRGVDPYVDYVFELQHPEETVRIYEWRGIAQAVRSFVPVDERTRWLDFGCGNGGLVRHVKATVGCSIVGYEHGWIQKAAQGAGIPFVHDRELPGLAHSYDVITAIEVLEHVEDPLGTLRLIRSLLRPGGLFFFTTGNLARHRRDPLKWPYALPEIHISFYEPRTVELALLESGFRPAFHGFSPGFKDITRFKVLKSLGVRRIARWEKVLPWPVLARMADRVAGVTDQPIGWAV